MIAAGTTPAEAVLALPGIAAMVQTLGVVVVLALLTVALVRRLAGRRGPAAGRGRSLEVIETLPLDGRRRLLLVRCGDVELLLAVHDHGVTRLAIARPPEPAAAAAAFAVSAEKP